MTAVTFGEVSENLPYYFERLLEKLKERQDASVNEYLYLAVLYNILESGFLLCNEKFNDFNTFGFNAQALKILQELSLPEIYTTTSTGNAISFSTSLRIGGPGNPVVTLVGEPSACSVSQFLIVNMFVKRPSCITSRCIKTADFVQKKAGAFVFKDRSKLSLFVKDELAAPLRGTLLLYQNPGCVPHLQRLPDHVFKIIVRNLPIFSKDRLTRALKTKYT